VRSRMLGTVEELALAALLGGLALLVVATSRSRSHRAGTPGDAVAT